jgi:bacterial/archaeal transporter family-2 protein
MGNVQYGAWAFAAGVLIPVMAAWNGALGRALGSTTWAAAILFAVGLAVTLPLALANGGWPADGLPRARPEQFLSGLVVAFYVLTATHLAPRFGVGPTILFVVTAQIVTAALISHFGWLGAPRQPVDWVRGAGLLLMVGGLALTQLRRA